MSDNLFMVEVLINKIEITEPPKPNRKTMYIQCSLGAKKFIIDSRKFENLDDEDKFEDDEMSYKFGKSILFAIKDSKLLSVMESQPMQLKIYDENQYFGYVRVTWDDNFLDLVRLSMTIDTIKPAKSLKQFKIYSEMNKFLGYLDLFLRLSSFGEGIQTKFYVDDMDNSDEIMFRNPNSSRVFRCDKIGSDVLPISTIYNPVVESQYKEDDELSISQLFFGERESVVPDVFSFGGSLTSMATIVDRRGDIKYTDIQNMVQQAVQGINVEVIENNVELTADKINRLMCNKTYCPVASKFKQFGIGPQATGKGLGTIIGDTDPPVTYGISNTYGVMENYGPFGLLQKNDNKIAVKEPIKEKKCLSCIKSEISTTASLCSMCEYSSLKSYGSEKSNINCCDPFYPTPLKLTEEPVKNKGNERNPLRLRGGGPGLVNNFNPASPLFQCQATLQQFDTILKDYKDALGPCGLSTCPNAPNLSKPVCKIQCYSEANECFDSQEPTNLKTCIDLDCPYSSPLYKGFKQKELKAQNLSCSDIECPFTDPHAMFVQQKINEYNVVKPACTSPACPYFQYKGNLYEEDAELELKFLPPVWSENCGHPECDYSAEKKLPPIHWECPDPLPKERCRNPNCPYIEPEDLKPKTKSPCGSSACPYTLPPPCELLSCPFRERPCPYKKEQKKNSDCCRNTLTDDDECDDPECVYNKEMPCCTQSGESINEDVIKTELPCCGNPNCPFTNPKAQKRNLKLEKCYKPNCHFSKTKSEQSLCYVEKASSACDIDAKNNICDNPDCPYSENNENEDRIEKTVEPIICTNQKCPFSENYVEGLCKNKDCPFNKSEKIKKKKICKNRHCVFAKDPVTEESPDELTCNAECGANMETKPVVKYNKKHKLRGKYVYSIGNTYPGIKMGHTDCQTKQLHVPPNMGWLWTNPMVGVKQRKGWIPGAIGKTIATKIREYRQKQGFGKLRLPQFVQGGEFLDFGDVNVTAKPTLQVKKKNGCYWITMNPLKDPKTLATNEDPYMNCTPLQFRIAKKAPEKPDVNECCCENESEKESSDSELDIEFTPPAGIIHPERYKKLFNVIHCCTQYDPKDFEKKKKLKDKEKGKDKKEKKDKKGKAKK